MAGEDFRSAANRGEKTVATAAAIRHFADIHLRLRGDLGLILFATATPESAAKLFQGANDWIVKEAG